MSGKLGLGTTWTRAVFPGALRAEVEALIPDGYRINVVPVNGHPGPWDLVAYGPEVDGDGRPAEVMRWERRHDPRTAVRVMARELAARVAP